MCARRAPTARKCATAARTSGTASETSTSCSSATCARCSASTRRGASGAARLATCRCTFPSRSRPHKRWPRSRATPSLSASSARTRAGTRRSWRPRRMMSPTGSSCAGLAAGQSFPSGSARCTTAKSAPSGSSCASWDAGKRSARPLFPFCRPLLSSPWPVSLLVSPHLTPCRRRAGVGLQAGGALPRQARQILQGYASVVGERLP